MWKMGVSGRTNQFDGQVCSTASNVKRKMERHCSCRVLAPEKRRAWRSSERVPRFEVGNERLAQDNRGRERIGQIVGRR